jgi:hypothetical protein
LAFFAARFSFRVLPGFFTLIFCGDLLDTTVLPHNVRMVRSLVGPAGTPAEAQPAPPPRAGVHPEQAWSDGHVISLTPIAPRPAGPRSARPVPQRRHWRSATAGRSAERSATHALKRVNVAPGAAPGGTPIGCDEPGGDPRPAPQFEAGLSARRPTAASPRDRLPGLTVDLQHRGAPRRRVRRRDATRPQRSKPATTPTTSPTSTCATPESSRKTGTTTCDSQPASWKPRRECPPAVHDGRSRPRGRT